MLRDGRLRHAAAAVSSPTVISSDVHDPLEHRPPRRSARVRMTASMACLDHLNILAITNALVNANLLASIFASRCQCAAPSPAGLASGASASSASATT